MATFAINPRVSRHCLAGAGDLWEARREGVTAPGPKNYLVAVPRRKASVAVEFSLVAPGGATG